MEYYEDDLEWYAIEHTYLVFLLTMDMLGLSDTLHKKLQSPIPDNLFTFPQRQKPARPIKAIDLF